MHAERPADGRPSRRHRDRRRRSHAAADAQRRGPQSVSCSFVGLSSLYVTLFALAGSALSFAGEFEALAPQGAGQEVDVALVLTVDVSGSIDYGEAELQRKGIAEAFLSREVVQAIQSGSRGQIAVSVVYFSSRDYGVMSVPRQLDDRPRSAERPRICVAVPRRTTPVGHRDVHLRRIVAVSAHARGPSLPHDEAGDRYFGRRREQCRPASASSS